MQRFADYLRDYGLDIMFLQTGTDTGKTFSSFCTRERFFKYFEEIVKKKGVYFSEIEIDSILNDLDPFYTGIVQLRLIQRVYETELLYHKRKNLSKPKEILSDIRTAVFPNKRVALQHALAAADEMGDGYLTKD